jgi:hypothetical protein
MGLRDTLFKKSNKAALQALILTLHHLRKKSDAVVLSPVPTGYSWLGVYNGGKSMFSEIFVELPHYYSQSIFSDKELNQLSFEIASLRFRQILFNGFPEYFQKLVNTVKAEQPGVIVGVIYHGFPAELSANKTVQSTVRALTGLVRQKKIQKIGFAKKGFGMAFEKLFEVPCFEMIYINPEPIQDIPKYNDGKVHIGVLVNNLFRKNFHTQVMAALLVENSVVHVTDASELDYLGMPERFIGHGSLKHEAFIRLLGSMHINFHVTFSEASGGQVCSESISQGVPCLSAYTSSFFDYNEELKSQLIVEGGDDPYFIYLKAVAVLKNQADIGPKCRKYGAYLNTLAKERIETFLAN